MNTYIESLYLSNVGKFNKLNVRFNPQMNVIIGPNGSGKTSILRGICSSFTANHLADCRCRDGATYNVHCVEKGELKLIGADNFVNKDQEYRQANTFQWTLHNEDGYKSTIIHQQHTYPLLAIGAYRYFRYIQIEGMKREAQPVARQNEYIQRNPEFIDSTAMPNIKQWMINRYFIIEKDWAKTEKKNWESLNKNLSTIAPTGTDFKLERIEKDLEPIFSLNGSECYLEELSSGYKSIISMIFTIIDWIEGVNTGDAALIDKAEGTVLIDEIDVHLHPAWQMSILESLRKIFPCLQFIVTTHSPQVVMSAKAGEVMVIGEDSDELDLEPLSRNFQSWQSKDVLRDLMNTYEESGSTIDSIQVSLDKALSENNLEVYDTSLGELSSLLHPSDSILKYYQLSRNKILLSHDPDNEE